MAKKVGKDRTNDYQRYEGIDKDYDFQKNDVNPSKNVGNSNGASNR